MADEKNKNVDPEEENENQFDDDEDFGLPDLDYDELDDEDSDLEDEPDFKDPEEEPEEVPLASDSSTEVSGESELDEDVEINVEDIDSSETEDWEKELEKELEEELKAEEAGGFYEEESYADFENTGDEDAINNSVFSGDDSEFDEPQSEPEEDNSYTAPAAATTGGAVGSSYNDTGNVSKTSYAAQYAEESNSKGKFAKFVVIGTFLFAVIGIVLWLAFAGGGDEAEPQQPVVEQKTPPPAKPAKEEPVAQEPAPQAAAPAKKQPAQPNNTTPGEITVLEQRTGKSYVVIGSFFDGDMANDYAKELANEGKSPMVIPPFKDYRFYRVAIAEFNNFKDAQASIESYENEFGQEVWPLRY